MVLTAAQTTAFFKGNDQMGIPHATILQFQLEGTSGVDDLADFKEDSLKQLADNLCCPGGCIPDPNPAAVPGATIPMPAFVFGAKSQARLSVACDLVRFYDTVGHDLTAVNMPWTHVAKNLKTQWKALKSHKDEDDPDIPKITRALPIMKWTEAFQDFLQQIVGVRMIPLAYIFRSNVVVSPQAPPLQANQPHSEQHGSVEAKMIARLLRTHALYRDDSLAVYYHLEEAMHGTTYAASIKPFQ